MPNLFRHPTGYYARQVGYLPVTYLFSGYLHEGSRNQFGMTW